MFIVASRWSRNRSPKRWISFIYPLVETISFFPRYYLVSPPLCHGPTKFEAFIECLGSEDRPLPQRSQDLLHLPSTAQISLRPSTCTCVLRVSIFHVGGNALPCMSEPRGRNIQCVFLAYSGPRTRPRFSLQRYTSVRRSAMHALLQIPRRDTG